MFCCSYSFLPYDDVISGFEKLVENDTIPDEFVSYFEYTYIGISRGRGVNKKRSSPFVPDLNL